jgi:hypothetical protein
MKVYFEQYVARSYASQRRVLAATGRAAEAKEAYKKAVKLQEQLVEKRPMESYHRVELVQTLASLADLLRDSGAQARSKISTGK